ncbi:MAG TPA: biotin--[acetyl-CoA-carboxylase] ligase [Candidatus Sulfopaludibacter sp.]|jgi:BirA family biotin operon repressor/biotin-[acetyl-CoA-carboxylase] ligase|nr:biotin--[acetyl-CoA-carboxylase] ligase [Candidatus Sulfopaludibacter sp.]
MTCDIEQLREAFPNRRIDYYDAIDSTMLAAAGLAAGSVVAAGEQTAGQGRHGHSWHSEAGNGLYFSVVLAPSPVLTLALGLAVAEAVAHVAGVVCDLRWPNDVMIGSAKLAGILVQLVDGRAIAGIGINVNHAAFPPELDAEAISLRMASGGREIGMTDLLIAVLRSIDSFVQEDKETILRLFTQSSSYAAGRRVTVALPGGPIEGTTAGLDADGFLIVRKDDGTTSLILAGGVRATGS